MKRHSRLWRSALLIGLACLAWLGWQSPRPALQPAVVRMKLPVVPQADVADHSADALSGKPQQTVAPQLWRVVTHRLISPAGIRAMRRRLVAMHTQPITIHTTEEMTMHAFDDAVLFKSWRQAAAMARFWQQHDIETNIIRAKKGVYLLGLGRYFQAEYASSWQQKLDRVGRKYRYQRRSVPVPVVRFTFPAAERRQAEQLWKRLNATGVVMPVLISENRFDKLYGDHLQPPQ